MGNKKNIGLLCSVAVCGVLLFNNVVNADGKTDDNIDIKLQVSANKGEKSKDSKAEGKGKIEDKAKDKESGFIEKTSSVTAKILDVEAVGSSSNVDYNTYFELKDGTIMRLEDVNVYTYARFNKYKSVILKITEGQHLNEFDDQYGRVDKELGKKKGTKFKYITDVLVNKKSIKDVV